MEVEETHTRRLQGQRETGETRGGQSGTHRGRCQFRNMPTMTSILSSRRKSTKKFSPSQYSVLLLQAQSSVHSSLGTLPGLPAEEQTGESDEEAGGAPRSAGEDLCAQSQPSSSSSSLSSSEPLLHPHTDQNQSHQEGKRLPASEKFFFFVFLVFPILFRSIILFDKPVSSLADCSCCRWRMFPGDTTSPQPSTVKGERQLLKS